MKLEAGVGLQEGVWERKKGGFFASSNITLDAFASYTFRMPRISGQRILEKKHMKINKSFNASLCLKLNQTIRSYDFSTKAIFNSSIDKIWEELQLNKGPLALQAIAQTFSSQL